ncbi:MAG: hypothetical protein JXX29_01710 [Deltaproteobacteria bacterium]|nr:hypothetical protein [Deltaproteobacteria bacterium]MBN2670356.1 hypothetical protein [Deltaproteobacteria bacterium]
MKHNILFIACLAIGLSIAAGCMDRKPAPVCPIPTELKSSDPGTNAFDGVDILVVVDNSGSMAEEQEMLATAFFPLVNTLINPTEGSSYPASDNVRIAITTSDMGVSYGGTPYTDTFTPHSACVDATKNGLGDNGAFINEYGLTEVNILENVIPCDADAAQCPTHWECDMSGGGVIGFCVDPNGDGTSQVCPDSLVSQSYNFVPQGYDRTTSAFTVACLASVGTEGCAYEQQLAAGAAGLVYDPTFIREKSLTAVLVVSDEEDCSLASSDWHNVDELASGSDEINVACGRHPDLLTTVADIKEQYDAAKTAVSGNASGMLFAGIIGVPKVTECQGRGNTLAECFAEPLEFGTMAEPEVIRREDRRGEMASFYEFACERYDDDNKPITQAYPGARYVEMAQMYGDMSYIYSICNDNWSTAMVDIAEMIAENMTGTCYGKRLNWDPSTETANCNVVFEYRTPKADSPDAPPCPDLVEKYGNEDFMWQDEGDVRVEPVKIGNDTTDFWVRTCTVEKIPAPLNCNDFDGMANADENQFGWYYCENPGENNSVACNDDLDNDRDGLVDDKDPDCDICSGKTSGVCPSDCPYKVSLSGPALTEAAEAFSANVVCLQQYRFEDPNCKESTADSCNDGEDNDGNGPFDCHSYSNADKEEGRIPEEHFPASGARNADPDCCPMRRNPDDGSCVFLNTLGQPAATVDDAAWVDVCQVGELVPENLPDSCCEASTALLCVLPDAYRNVCEARN